MNGLGFFAAFVLFIGGIVLFAFGTEWVGFEAIAFTGGILAVALSLALPFHILRSADR